MQKKGIVLKCQGNPVSCYGKRAAQESLDEVRLTKKGIVLKCQGNPVSCYGKRAAAPDMDMDTQQEQLASTDYVNSSEEHEQEQQIEGEENYERLVKTLIESCRGGSDKSCAAVMRMMLMNMN